MKKFLVAEENGGLMEDPKITYSNYQIIEANTPEEACEIYNKKNNCNFFYGECLAEYNEETKTVTLPITFFIKE